MDERRLEIRIEAEHVNVSAARALRNGSHFVRHHPDSTGARVIDRLIPSQKMEEALTWTAPLSVLSCGLTAVVGRS
jgi:hypothetical protein